jgi:hypothetical protein
MQFVGRVHVELSSYEADIVLRSGNRVHAREYDHISGKLCEGKTALRNIIERAKEPNGRINVYTEREEQSVKATPERVFIDEAIASGARKMAYGTSDTIASSVVHDLYQSERSLARDRAELKELILELLLNASAAFAKQRLDFESLFQNACHLNSDRYDFLDPETASIEFKEGRLFVDDSVSAQQLAIGVSAVLGYMLLRLRESRDLRKLYNFTMHRMRPVLGRRNSLLERLMIKRQFEKLVEY